MLGESVAVIFTATGVPASTTVTLDIKISDEFGTEIASTFMSMTANASGQATASYTAPTTKYGYYRVAAVLSDGTTIAGLGTRPAGFVSYAVVPDPAKRVNYGDASSRFGMQGGFSTKQGDVARYLGVRLLLDGAGWSNLEPAHAGQFAAAVSTALAKGEAYPAINVDPALAEGAAPWQTYQVPVVLQASLPAWALEAGTSGTICKSMGAMNAAGAEAFPAFTQALAERVAASYAASQSLHYYQITWEPAAGWCFNGTTAQLLQFYQLSYAAIHKADPKAIVMGPTLFPNDGPTITSLFAAGLADYIDAVSMHPYVAFPPETNGLVADVRAQMKTAQAAKGTAVPFVGTEHGYTSGSIGELNEALGDIRETIMLLGEGFKFDFAFYVADFWDSSASETSNTYGYYWNLDPNLDYGSDKIGPKPAAPAFAAMTQLLDGSTSVGPMANLTGSQMGYRFTRNGTTILALWDYGTTSTANLTVPGESIQTCNWMGNCTTSNSGGSISLKLGSSPTYVIGNNL